MKHAKAIWVGCLFLVLCLIPLVRSLDTRGQVNKAKDNGHSQQMDFSRFPIVDFTTQEPSGPNSSTIAEARARKYNNKYMARISEETNQIFLIVDWDVKLPALPVAQSRAVLTGTVNSSKAHLTPDKTNVFSEFEIAVDTVFKQDDRTNVRVGKTLTVERIGGRVRLPSGKIVVSWVNHQNMPRVGAKYVLFLTHDFQSRDDGGNDFNLLTGYELREGKVFPLDDTAPGHPITAYAGTDESKLLSDLTNAIAKTSNSSNDLSLLPLTADTC
jgi:hypothetical protein